MSLKQYRAFYSVQCRRTYSDTWNMSCIFMSVNFSAPSQSISQTYVILVVVVVVVVVNGSYSAAAYSSPDRECITKVKIKHRQSTEKKSTRRKRVRGAFNRYYLLWTR